MSTRSGRTRPNVREISPPRTRKGVTPPRTPTRTRKTSPPARSPARKSPSRNKSPSRKPASKFPARKSPSRTTKEATDTAAQKSPRKRAGIKSDVTVNLQDITKLEVYTRGTRTRRSEYSIKDLSSGLVQSEFMETAEKLNGVDINDMYGLRNRKSFEEVIPRRSDRLREFMGNVPDIRRSLSKSDSKSISKSVSQSIDTFSDEDNSEEELLKKKTESVTRRLATPLRESVSKLAQTGTRWEFGGRIGSALLLLLLPLTVFSILIACKKSCSYKSLLNVTGVESLAAWFSLETFGVLAVQHLIQAGFVLAPIFGTKGADESGTKLHFNAFFSSVFTMNILFALNFFNIFNSDSLLNEYLKLAVSSYVIAVVLSIILYVKTRKMDDSELNPYGNTGYVIYDFCMGREIHPYIKKLDVKIWIARITNINALILGVLIFKHGILLPAGIDNVNNESYKGFLSNVTIEKSKAFLSKVQLKPTILLYSMMQIVYNLNFIMKEHKITTTFFWQSEGLGYLQLVSSALYPFYFTIVSKFIVDSQVSLSTNVLISASVLYLLGFSIMLISNNIKHEFRKNPLHPSLAKLESMPTFHGKKLLISGIWGALRHPNYTGDILIQIALALPGVLTGQYIAAAPAVLTVLLLLHRAWRDHHRCRRRYGAAWERYCKRVPSVIIPKVL